VQALDAQGAGLPTGTSSTATSAGAASSGAQGVGLAISAVLDLVAIPVLLAPHVALLGLAAGVGAPISLQVDQPIPGVDPSRTVSLFDAPDTRGALVLLVLVVLALLIGATVSALWAPDQRAALRRGWELGPVLLVVTLAATLLTGLGVEGSVLGTGVGASIHLDALLAPLLMLGWGALLGTGGALVARVLPGRGVAAFRARLVRVDDAVATPPHGFPPPARRGGAVVALALAVVAVLAVVSGAAAWASTPSPAPITVADGGTTTLTPETTTTAPPVGPLFPTQEPTPTSTPFAGGVDGVGLGPAAAGAPDASAVQAVLGRYFAAINAHDYDAWAATVLPSLAVDQPRADWLRGYRSTVDDIMPTGTGAIATVRYRSLQDPADAPRGLPYSCISWQTQLPATGLAAGGLVGAAPRQATRGTPC